MAQIPSNRGNPQASDIAVQNSLPHVGSLSREDGQTVFNLIDAELAKIYQDRNILLTGGIVSYGMDGASLTFLNDLNLELNSTVDGSAPIIINVALAGQTKMVSANGRMIYAVLDRSTGTAAVVEDANALPPQSTNDNEVFLICKRRDEDGIPKVYFRNGFTINANQSASLDVSDDFSDNSFSISKSSNSTVQFKVDVEGYPSTSTTLLTAQTTNQILTLPNITDTLITKTTNDTGLGRLQNKDLDDTTTHFVDSSDVTKRLKFDVTGSTFTDTVIQTVQTDNRIITLPDATDTLVGRQTDDTGINRLKNKDLEDLTISIVDSSDYTKKIKFDAGGVSGTSTTVTAAQTTDRTINLPDDDGTILLASGNQSIVTTGNVTIETPSNQLVLGTTNTTTISATPPGVSVTYTIPDVGTNADFVMTQGNQTISGNKTFQGTVTVNGKTFINELGYEDETAIITASTLSPAQSKPIIRITSADSDLNMISNPSAGKVHMLVNTTPNIININNNTGAITANRIITGTGSAVALDPDAVITVVYDADSSCWRVAGGAGGGSVGFASEVSPGIVSIDTQSFGGDKIFRKGVFQRTPYSKTAQLITKAKSGVYKRSSAESISNNFILSQASENNSWQSVCWSPELGLFAAVAANGTNRVMTSSDGVTWISRAIGESTWQSICWSSELKLFVAVANSGTNRVLTSPDGITWTLRVGNNTSSWQSVCWSSELGLFVAVSAGGSNAVMTSPNGITWTGVTAQSGEWSSVCWSPELGLFVAVASYAFLVGRVMTSPDGINWTRRNPSANNSWQSVCWSPELGLFVAVATFTNSIAGSKIVMTSPDGINWTSADSSFWEWKTICWSAELGLFVAVADSYDVMMTSPDGINWTQKSLPPSPSSWKSICWSPELGIFTAVANNGPARVMISPSLGQITADKQNILGIKNFINPPTISDASGIAAASTSNPGIVTTGSQEFSGSKTFSSPTVISTNSTQDSLRITQQGTGNSLVVEDSTNPDNTPFIIDNVGKVISSNVTLQKTIYGKPQQLITKAKSGNYNRSSSISSVSNWAFRNAAEENFWTSICWSPELGLFVAVAGTGTNRIMTSPDGVTWTGRTAPEANIWENICWAAELGLFVAVSSNGTNRVMTSPDGVTWTSRTSPSSEWRSICWSAELGLFVAVSAGGSNAVMTSPDGITWTPRTALSSFWLSVCWSAELGLFVAVGGTGTTRVMTSHDGITWSSRTSPLNVWTGISWSPELGLFAAVTDSGSNQIMTSPDGITWTGISTPTGRWRSICWSAELGLFLVISYNSATEIIISRNGVNWTNIKISSSDLTTFSSVCWAPELGMFAAVANSGTNQIMTTPNTGNTTSGSQILGGIKTYTNVVLKKTPYSKPQQLVTKAKTGTYNRSAALRTITNWTGSSSPVANIRWNSICWSAELGLFVTVSLLNANSNTANQIMTSPDGVTWTTRLSPEVNAWWSVCWSAELGLFVAVASTGTNRIMTSPDGVTWTGRTAPEANNWNTVCWAAELGLFVAVADSGTNRVMTSPDGITWTARSAPLSFWRSICWSAELGLFVAVADSGTNRVMTSPDGITWTPRASSGSNWYAVCWSAELGLFVAVSPNSGIITSPDGVTWTNRVPPHNNSWFTVCWSADLGLFIATGSTAAPAMASSDGITWTAFTPTVNNVWASVCWSPELGIFAAVADSGTTQFATTAKAINSRIAINPSSISSGVGNAAVRWNSTSGLLTYDTSSRLTKTDIEVNPYGIEDVMQLKPAIYTRTDCNQKEVGFIADEMLEVIPEVVSKAPKKLFTHNEEDEELIPAAINYEKLTSVLVKAIQELKIELDLVKQELDKFKK